MKKFFIFLFIAVLLVGTISAQAKPDRQREISTVTVDGSLKLEKGLVAVESGENVYMIPMLTRYIGFINELKEGANISVEGYSFKNFINPTKVTIAGKSYDFASGQRPAFGAQNNKFGPERRSFVPNQRNSGPNRGKINHGRDLRPQPHKNVPNNKDGVKP